MADAPRHPFCSAPAVARNAPTATKAFGDTWQEVVTRVEAFGIEAAATKIVEIDNYTHDETRASEYVRKVEVSYTEEIVTAIKLYTSKRTTPWYGACAGARQVFEADEGLCINALRGQCGPDGCSQLGVVFASVEIANEGHSIAKPRCRIKRVLVYGGSPAWITKDLTCALAPRAIVVTTTDSTVERVRVVTAQDYDRVVKYPGSFEHNAQEQWLVLVEGERLEAIGVDIVHKRIRAVRFRTNLQTSHASGTASKAEVMWLEAYDHPDAYICGFEFEATNMSGEAPITVFATMCTMPARYIPHITEENAAATVCVPPITDASAAATAILSLDNVD